MLFYKTCSYYRLEASGNCLQVFSNQPCVQLYQGGHLDGSVVGRDGNSILQYGGICLETQKHPNAINQVYVIETREYLVCLLLESFKVSCILLF